MRTLDPKELAEMRETIFLEIATCRQYDSNYELIPPDDVFQFDCEEDYFNQAALLLESAADADNPDDMYSLAVDAVVTLVELLELLRDTGKLTFPEGEE